jgi:hypothetical protein
MTAHDNSNAPTKIVRLKDLLDIEGGGVLELSDGADMNVESGGEVAIKSGGLFNVESGGALQIAGVDLTAPVAALASDLSDFQKIVGIQEVMIASVGTWTKTRVARGDYVLRHTDADDTSVLGIDITEAIRTTTAKGFKLASFDVIHKIGTAALEGHTVTLDKIAYANNVAVAVTSISLTGSLSTATQAQPYVNNVAVATPAFNITAASKYVLELTVNAATTSVYDFYGINLRFTRSQA